MITDGRAGLVRAVARAAKPMRGGPEDFDPVLDRAASCRLVLLGEGSHGTHEFYRIRAEITKRLITEQGFEAVAVESDWPDSWRVHRYVTGRPGDADATDALGGMRRFPQWMWRNADVLDFVGWLRRHNDGLPAQRRPVGYYGLDLYSLHESIAAVLSYLDLVDPDAAERARARYACFDHTSPDPQAYGYGASIGITPSCEAEVVAQLRDLRHHAAEYARRDGRVAPEDAFFAERNAALVHSAERYYRAMMGSRVVSWNLRDTHMVATLEAISEHLESNGGKGKVVVWAHNSHLGDARATEMGDAGELNVGQIVRQHWGAEALLVGFTTHTGTVTAANDWDEPAQRMTVRPSLPGSVERIFHDTGLPRFVLDLGTDAEVTTRFAAPFLERAIGVIYRPETERLSHYFRARLSQQFDLVLHYDETRAVEPLERTGVWDRGELAETFPSAL